MLASLFARARARRSCTRALARSSKAAASFDEGARPGGAPTGAAAAGASAGAPPPEPDKVGRGAAARADAGAIDRGGDMCSGLEELSSSSSRSSSGSESMGARGRAQSGRGGAKGRKGSAQGVCGVIRRMWADPSTCLNRLGSRSSGAGCSFQQARLGEKPANLTSSVVSV